jgi:hypothetical protein
VIILLNNLIYRLSAESLAQEMMQEGSLMLPGGNSGLITPEPEVPIGTPTTLSPIVDQRSPPRKLSRQNDGGNGQNLSLNAGGEPQLLDGMAEVTVERVTRTQQRCKPEATTLRNEVGELQNALLRNQYWSAEEITQQRAHFENCARDYEVQARDVRDVEVAQAVDTKDSQIINAEGQIVAIRSQLQNAIDRNSSGDISLRQIEDSAQHHYDNLLEQRNVASQQLWHVETNAENRLGQIENRAQTLESESEAKLEATLQQQKMMQRSGHQLEETLQQETMQ